MISHIKEPRSCGVHDGSFHADEVTAIALLVQAGLIDMNKVVRTRDENRLAACDFVCDVGGVYDPASRRFDHHQVDYQGKLSSAGMILEYLKETKVFSEEYAAYLHRTLVHGVDLIDTGAHKPEFGVCTFSGVIANFMPVSYESIDEELHQAFFEAVDFVYRFLVRSKERFDYMASCKEEVVKAMKAMQHCLVFDRPLSWLETFFEMDGERHPAEFVIMPAGKNWKLRGIPPSYADRMKVRVPMPKAWAGLMKDELNEVSKLSGGVFCHKERFISIWETKEAALKAWKMIVRGGKDENDF